MQCIVCGTQIDPLSFDVIEEDSLFFCNETCYEAWKEMEEEWEEADSELENKQLEEWE